MKRVFERDPPCFITLATETIDESLRARTRFGPTNTNGMISIGQQCDSQGLPEAKPFNKADICGLSPVRRYLSPTSGILSMGLQWAVGNSRLVRTFCRLSFLTIRYADQMKPTIEKVLTIEILWPLLWFRHLRRVEPQVGISFLALETGGRY